MKLECAQSISSSNPNSDDIERAFADDHGRGEFIILIADDDSFIQAAGESDGPYVLEYRDAKIDKHFSAVGEFTKEQVKSAFLSYLGGNTDWHDTNTWEELENKGCFGKAAMTILGLAVVTIAILVAAN